MKWQKSIECTLLDRNQKVTHTLPQNPLNIEYPFIKDNFLRIMKYDEPPKDNLDHLSASLVINIHFQICLACFITT